MTNAEQLAKEIVDAINAKWHNPPDYEILVGIIAARIKPLVERLVKTQIPMEVLRAAFQEQNITELCSSLQIMVIRECLANRKFLTKESEATHDRE